MRISRIFYLLPSGVPKIQLRDILYCRLKRIQLSLLNRSDQSGGPKIAFLHCELLRQLGYDASPLYFVKPNVKWFKHSLKPLTVSEVGINLDKNDILISPEVLPYDHLKFNGGYKILFCQNQGLILNYLNPSEHKNNYLSMGYNQVICPSQHIKEHLKFTMGLDTFLIRNGIDLDKFKPDPIRKIPNRVLCLPRKNPQDIKKIEKITRAKYPMLHFVYKSNISEEQLIEEYQCAQFFIASGYPEGFQLPALEAMACGCVVVGFTGGGAAEFMIDQSTAMVAPDGDCEIASSKLVEVAKDQMLQLRLQQNGMRKAQEYPLSRMKNDLKDFYKMLENIN